MGTKNGVITVQQAQPLEAVRENLAERGGFEPPVGVFSPYNGLANRRIQPLCHLSAVCHQQLTIKRQKSTGQSLARTQLFQARWHFLHRSQHCRLEYFDVALPGDVGFGMAQNALNDFVVRAQCKKDGDGTPPRKKNRESFAISDRTKALELPRDGQLVRLAESVESAMKDGAPKATILEPFWPTSSLPCPHKLPCRFELEL